MSIFDLNKVEKSSSLVELAPGIRSVKLSEVVSKKFEQKSGEEQHILEFKFIGINNDKGVYSETFYESSFDKDGTYNSDKTDEEFQSALKRNLSKIRTIIDKFMIIENLPAGKDFPDLCNKISDLFKKDESWKTIEGEIKLVYNSRDKIVTPLFKFLSTQIDKESLKITSSKYDRITPLEKPNTDKAFDSLADDFEDSEKDDDFSF